LSGKLLKQIGLLSSLHQVQNSVVTDIHVRGKVVFIQLQSQIYLEFSHGMTGYWTDIYIKHSRIEITYNGGSIYFNDSRNFGNFHLLTHEQYQYRISRLGPSILTDNISCKGLRKKSRSELCKVLMDQSVISGIGNYLRAEIMWYLFIFKDYFGLESFHYNIKIGDLSDSQLETILYVATQITRYYSNLSYRLFFTPKDFDPYRTTFVYSQKEDPFGNKIHKITYHSRTLHYITLL
jgi:formamidopyrimidine-DNA glycosylase